MINQKSKQKTREWIIVGGFITEVGLFLWTGFLFAWAFLFSSVFLYVLCIIHLAIALAVAFKTGNLIEKNALENFKWGLK